MEEEIKNPGLKCAISYAKSILFYVLSKESYKNQDIISSTINLYYSIFHLCDGLYEIQPIIECEGIKNHKLLRLNTKKLVHMGKIDPILFNVIDKLYDRRNNVNYEPKTYSRKKGGIFFHTCRFPDIKKEIGEYQIKMQECYLHFLKFVKDKHVTALLKDWIMDFPDFYLKWGVISQDMARQSKVLIEQNFKEFMSSE